MFEFNKKSQSLSINTIIIAAIGLAVLVVLFVVFTGRFKVFSEGVKSSDLNCKKACETTGYMGGGPDNSPYQSSGCQNKLAGRFSDVDPQTQVCCCVA